MSEVVQFQLDFSAGERRIEASVGIPAAPMRLTDLLPVLFGFSNALVGLAEDVSREHGKAITCRAGCGACCRQVVPVSEAEARHIAELVAAMPAEQREHVRERFHAAVLALGDEILGQLRDTASLKSLDARRAIGTEYFRKGVACPFLENESCSIHEQRPLSCREYLVTSPAEHCNDPGPDTIAPVPMPLKLSETLYCFSAASEPQSTRWVPLVLALEWAESHVNDAEPLVPGSQLFERFLARLAPNKP